MKVAIIILITLLFNKSYSQTVPIQSADYIIAREGSIITAYPQSGTTLPQYSGPDAYTVIQSAINTLTLFGSTGTGGGKIHINRGIYYLTGELTIIGWENTNNPFSQLVIEGDGFATQIVQNSPGKNAIVVKNAACIALRDLRVYTGRNAKSCLLADDNGAGFEISCNKSIIDNVIFGSNSTSSPAVYLKNFFDLNMSSAHIENTNNHALILENDSKTINYGNSSFGFLRCVSSAAEPYAGLLIRTTNKSTFMNQLTFNNYECVIGYYGIYSDCLRFSSFNLVDLEDNAYPIYLTGSSAGNETRSVIFNSGYLLPRAGKVAITNTVYTGANTFNLFIEGDHQVIPIMDQSQFRPPNGYNLTLSPNIRVTNIKIKSDLTVPYIIKTGDGRVVNKLSPKMP